MEKKEAIEVLKPLLKDLALEPEREALQTALSCLEQLSKHPYPNSVCEVCWTASYTPCPKDTPNAQAVVGKDEWVVCQQCEVERNIKILTAEKGKLEEEKIDFQDVLATVMTERDRYSKALGMIYKLAKNRSAADKWLLAEIKNVVKQVLGLK